LPKPNKQAAQLKQIRNIKKLNLDNKLNKNLEYASSEKDPDSDKEIDNGFIYETDNSDGEWFNDAFINLISKSKDKDVWKTEGRPKIYTGSSTRTLCRNKNI
jgi:hypothetical protein